MYILRIYILKNIGSWLVANQLNLSDTKCREKRAT